jgi:hypothetical protein
MINNFWYYIKRDRWYHVYVLLIILCIVAGMISYGRTDHPPKPYIFTVEEVTAKVDLENEMQMLKHIPEANYGRIDSFYKNHTYRKVSVTFDTNLDFSQVHSHYDKQLKALGWIENPGSFHPLGKTVDYKKGNYTAQIGHESGDQYSLRFEWEKN